MTGSIYEDKVEHCNNLLHWVPFGLKNEAPDVTNFYSRDNMETRRYACEGGGHCIEKSPLFAVIGKWLCTPLAFALLLALRYVTSTSSGV